jgi:predicted ATPase/DNA-binding SARP family transcriptional activator
MTPGRCVSLEPQLSAGRDNRRVWIRLLGGVGAVSDGGEPVDVGPAKCQALLAALALSPDEAVPVWRLVELVWGQAPPRTAERTLQSYVTRLRKALGSDAIVRTGLAYRLAVPAEAIDAARFERRLDAGDVEAALTEWTGVPLAGVDAPGLTAPVDALVERWLGAVELDLEGRVERDPAAAIGALTELTAAHRFREGLWALLMTALYRVGRQADALAAYRTARERLVEELGIEPGPRLRELETLILGHDEQLATPPPLPTDRRANLPCELTRLIGRDADLDTVEQALRHHRVVTLVGPGGIGKTRLAIAAAHRVDGEAWLIELAEIAEPGDVPRVVADTLGVTESPGRALTESVATALRSRRALVVLDNCEHVLAAATALARAVAEGCPDVRVLASSREPLGISGERLIEVGPLAREPGIELFNERAAAASSAFDPHGSLPAVEAICRRLDGIPLGIELAAARTRSLSPEELSRRLRGRLGQLSGGRRTGAERHRTLTATIQWSYDLLTPPERALLARLSVFAGPFALTAAEAVAAHPDLDVDAGLADLVDRSMLLAEHDRFRLLEPIREFAAGQLAQTGEAAVVAERHGGWCREESTAIGRLLAGLEERKGVERLDQLWPNLRAAFERACSAGDRALARTLVRPVVAEVLLRSRQEIGDWLERLLTITPREDEQTIVFALAWSAQRYAIAHDADAYDRLSDRYQPSDHPLLRHAHASVHEDWDVLMEWAPRAVAEHRRRGDDDLAEHAEIDIGAALLNLGRLEEHDAVVRTLAERYRTHGPPTLLNWTLMLLGYSATFQGAHDRAERLFEEAVAIAVPERTHSPNRPIEARIAFRHGDRPRALRILRSHIDELLDTDNMQGASITAVEFINIMAALDRVADAARMLAYLGTTGLLDAPPFRTLIEHAARKVAADGDRPLVEGPISDDRRALEHMRRTLDTLIAGGREPGQHSPSAAHPRSR